jgi:prepilin peptidase CpaA
MSVPYIAVLATAIIACVCDLRTRRIPNTLTLGAALGALVFHVFDGGMSGLGSSVAGWLVGPVLLFILFTLGGMGAGDLKLLGALGAWLGPADALWLVLFSAMSGGVMALAIGLINGCLVKTWSNIGVLLMHWRVAGLQPLPELTLETSPGPRLAYAAPILTAAVVVVWLR